MVKWLFILIIFCALQHIKAQYTDQINSNRPGVSIGAFAVGKNVIQFETATEYREYRHYNYNKSKLNAGVGFFSFRWGVLSERFEINYQAQFLEGFLFEKNFGATNKVKQKGFLQNSFGLKLLLFDPFKKERKPNLYSWKANNNFQLRDLIPAVSLTAGINFNFEEQNPFSFGNIFSNLYQPLFYQNLGIQQERDSFMDYRLTLATQSHFLKTWVFVTNFTLNRISSKYPEKSYILTLTHSFNPRGSVYIENQGIFGTYNIDVLFRTGVAFLLNRNLQIESSVGANIKTTPSIFLTNLGISYRLDFHKKFKELNNMDDKKSDKPFSKSSKKTDKALSKNMRKTKKEEKKRNRKAARN